MLAMLALDLEVFHKEAHEGVIHEFHYLKLALSLVLVFVGVKMLVTYVDYHVPIGLSLGLIGGVLFLSVVTSLMFPKAAAAHDPVIHDPLGRRPPDPLYAPIGRILSNRNVRAI